MTGPIIVDFCPFMSYAMPLLKFIGQYLENEIRYLKPNAIFDQLGPMMTFSEFRQNWAYNLGGDVKNVFFKKFKMA